MKNSIEARDMSAEIKFYGIVFASFALLTLLKIVINHLNLGTPVYIAAVAVVSLVNVGVVIWYFKHLVSQNRLIVGIMLLTIFFVIFLLSILIVSLNDPIAGTKIVA